MAISVTGLTVHTQVGTGTFKDYESGPGGGSSTAIFLSSTSSYARKFTGFKGFAFQVNAAGTDLSNTVILVRILVNGGIGATLAADGIRIRLEDTSGNISDWTVGGSDTYSGGWAELVIDTANAETDSTITGTPATLTAIQYVGIYLNASAASGGDPNVYLDEILSYPNTGLTLAGNTTQLFDELYTFDDTSKYGIISKRGGVVFSKTPLILSPDATGHTSVDEIVVFEEPVYEDGTNVDSALTLHGLSSADTDAITLTRLITICEDNGDITGTNADKELDFSSATNVTASTCTFRGFSGTDVALGGSGNSYADCIWQGCNQITDTGAVVRSGFVRDTAAIATEASLLWTSSSDWEDTTFIMGSTNSHAIEIETNNLTDTWTGFTFTGYNATAGPTTVGNEVLNNQSTTGTVTISAVGTIGTISFYNRGGGATDIQTSVSVSFEAVDASDAAIQSARVTAYLVSDDSEVINTTTNVSGIAATSFSGTTPADIYYRYRKSSPGSTKYVNLSGFATIEASTGVSVKRNMREDTTADPSL
jgi:hypothetical protein